MVVMAELAALLPRSLRPRRSGFNAILLATRLCDLSNGIMFPPRCISMHTRLRAEVRAYGHLRED